MAPSIGFEEGVVGLQSYSAIGATDHSAGGMTCLTGHPRAANGPVTGRANHKLSMHIDATCMHTAQTEDDGRDSSSDGADVDPVGVRNKGKEEGTLGAPDAPPLGEVVHTSMHYYVDVPNSEENAYQACNRNVEIDLGFHEHLQEKCEAGDISTFFALPKIIPARQRRRQQPLLDFTKSKILTSRKYTKSCERVLAQMEATQAEAKQKADLREATKET